MEKQVYYQDTISRFICELVNIGCDKDRIIKLARMSGDDEELKQHLLQEYRNMINKVGNPQN